MNVMRWCGAAGLLLLGFAVSQGCTSTPKEDSQTHFFGACKRSAECTGGLSCVCGRCSTPCPEGVCPGALGATCLAASTPLVQAVCGSGFSQDLCVPGEACRDGGGCEPPACSGESCTDGAPSLPPISACVTEPAIPPLRVPTYVSSLPSFCAALETSLLYRCPVDLAAYLATVSDYCLENASKPSLDRRCGIDHVRFAVDFVTLSFQFDSATGALMGASAIAAQNELPCGGNQYRGGPALPDCPSSDASCELCMGEPDTCPPDISAVLPALPCGPEPSEPPSCSCTEAPEVLPENGALCDTPDRCRYCGAGTCWAECRCFRDGVRRYVHGCTE